jgi:hypothetical protein
MSIETIHEIFLFDPLSIPDCCLWLDASDRTTLFSDSLGTLPVSSGSQTVSYWKDKSSSNNNATNTSNQPTLQFQRINNYPSVSFNGAQYLTLSSTLLPTDYPDASYFFVVKTILANEVQVFFSYGTSPTEVGRTPQFFFENGNLYADTFGSNAIYDTINITNKFVVGSFTRNAFLKGWVNGSSFIGSNNSPLTTTIGTGFATLGVGRVITTPFYNLHGEIAEVIIYNSELNQVNRQLIEGYLANKWGLNQQLPSNHPYFTYRPLMSNFPLPFAPVNPFRMTSVQASPYETLSTLVQERIIS